MEAAQRWRETCRLSPIRGYFVKSRDLSPSGRLDAALERDVPLVYQYSRSIGNKSFIDSRGSHSLPYHKTL